MKSRRSLQVACDRALSNLQHEGISDVPLLEPPFEISLLDDNVKRDLRDEIVNKIESGSFESLRIKPARHVLIPKKTLADFRNCAAIDITDEAIYLTLVLALARQIELNRIPKGKDIVFSYRFQYNEDTGALFDPHYSLKAFQAETRKRKNEPENRLMVYCDIASFYDRLNLHRLNSTLLSMQSLDEDIIKLIDDVLLFWSGRNSYSLPVGSNASRILAEAELIEVDNYLIKHGVNFCRFVDDYRIFAKDATEANKNLERLVFALKREGLFLNSGKTKIEDISMLNEPVKTVNIGKVKGSAGTFTTGNQAITFSSYAGTIPLRYRKVSEREADILRDYDIGSALNDLDKSVTFESDVFKQIIKAMEVQQDYTEIMRVIALTKKCPQFIPYVIDFIEKHSDNYSDKTKKAIESYFKDVFLSNETPEFIRIALSELYSEGAFANVSLIVSAFLSLQRDSGEYLGRVFLERIAGKTSRLETLELRDHGATTDINELRALARVVLDGLPEPEGKAYIKNIRIHYDDFFLNKMKKSTPPDESI